MKQILMSQLLALIAVSFDTKKITCSGWYGWSVPDRIPDLECDSHQLELRWNKRQYLCMTLTDCRKPYRWCTNQQDYQWIFRAFYFSGDNCNDRSRFLFSIMADETPIIDDIGIIGGGYAKPYKNGHKHNLLTINPHQLFSDKVNHRGRYAPKEAR